ncbi:MAG: AIR synthase-related protein [Lachnospiraceae bacterium]|nr:AIR synthase-related protein [Lachnospiraceae bacterium]
MDIIISKYIGIRGTAILARERYSELISRYPEWLIDEASCFDENLPEASNDLEPIEDVRIALENGAAYAKEYTEFGIFEALFQMAKTLKCGIRVNIKDIPIKQETVEVCEFLGVNPYALFSGSSAVIVTEDGARMISLLEENGILGRIVGYTTKEDNDKIVINDEERGFLQHIRKDELKNILGRRDYHERTDSINC